MITVYYFYNQYSHLCGLPKTLIPPKSIRVIPLPCHDYILAKETQGDIWDGGFQERFPCFWEEKWERYCFLLKTVRRCDSFIYHSIHIYLNIYCAVLDPSLNREIMFAITSKSPKLIALVVKYKNLNYHPSSTLFVTGKRICWLHGSIVQENKTNLTQQQKPDQLHRLSKTKQK